MKKDIHPDYRLVVFHDVSSDFKILTRSTVKTKQTATWEDGQEYPLVVVDVSSNSHPFYTGKTKSTAVAGRVEKFKQKFSGQYGKGQGRGAKKRKEDEEE